MTCSGVTSILGVEYLAECKGGNTYRFLATDILCENGQVTMGSSQSWSYGGAAMTLDYFANAIKTTATYSSSKILASPGQKHYILVTNTFAKYNGVVDGISLKSLPSAPTINEAAFTSIAIVAEALDKDGDGYDTCSDCDDENFYINPGELEVCGDGEDNNCNELKDCEESVCSEDPTCTTLDINSLLYPRDRCLNR